MRLLLLRHGQTPSNVRGLLDTASPGPGLTALGERQAAAVPDALRDRAVDAIAVSSLVRTALTAAPLVRARGIEPVTLTGLREIEAGDLEMAATHESHVRYLETVFGWARGDVDRPMPGGPDGRAFLARYDEAVAAIAASGADSAVVVSHGAAIRTWVAARADGVDIDHAEQTALANTGLVEVEGDPAGGWRLVDWSAAPVGGPAVDALLADDPTGEPVDD
ncbi:histidine phosphatase family protein [Promicromonospora thailandica]|uniref:Phosphoglycerate mutase n=1 Tax=Promicromonospora thailandica TaxID=765201 RepID=A0A9X2JX95_9MICO|nr:histidine phosphatase family protein [Promicromonospora thailandica]MCP2265968.1 putative phosphoglycerate mutase [Promicromonospora thailandica]BFF21453.1 histidine phosphatase family protein [Promicromonospora thailandica]